jgi:TRAP-type C4-dicarboxylate transport system substrate-binding protein
MKTKKMPAMIKSLLVSMIIVLFQLTGASAASEPITLKVASYFPSTNPQSMLLKEFADELVETTGGRIRVEYYPGGTLFKATGTVDGITSGVADIGLSHVAYSPGRFPVMEACELPIGYPSPWVANQVINDFYSRFKPKEFNNLKVLWMHASGSSMLLTKQPVRKLEDLKGMMIRAPGYTGEVIKALGGEPSSVGIMETYDALSNGTLDGAFVPFETLKAFKFAEVVKYATKTWFVGSSYPFYVVMNKASYKRLPPDLKEIFDHLTGIYRGRFALMWNAIEFPAKMFAKQKGVHFMRIPYNQQKLWKDAAKQVIDNYINAMKAKGFKEKEINSWFTFLRQRSYYWYQKQEVYQIRMP